MLRLPLDLNKQIIEATERIRERLKEIGWRPWPKPEIEPLGSIFGEAIVEGYSILGLEKYLGMVDRKERIAYFPSVKLTNDSTVTRTYVRFEPALKEDLIFIGGKRAEGREKERVLNVIESFRKVTGVSSKVIVVSENFFKGGTSGKGLGTSASAGASLALALIEASVPHLKENTGFVESIARIMAGSAGQSVAGGFSVWLSNESYLQKPYESFSVRIDKGEIPVKLVVVPIHQSTKTEEVHELAVTSPHYVPWCQKKVRAVPDLVEAIIEGDLRKIGEHAEDDSNWLHEIIVSTGGTNNWEPDTQEFIQKVKKIRTKGLTAFYSIDTGPSVAVLTTQEEAELVKEKLEQEVLDGKYRGRIFIADLAGGPEVLPLKEKWNLISDQINEELKKLEIEI